MHRRRNFRRHRGSAAGITYPSAMVRDRIDGGQSSVAVHSEGIRAWLHQPRRRRRGSLHDVRGIRARIRSGVAVERSRAGDQVAARADGHFHARLGVPVARFTVWAQSAARTLMARRVVVVSGAGGFIGRWSVPRLVAGGYEVHAVAARAPGRALPAQLSGAEIHYADLLREESVDALMQEVRPSHLLHFAWVSAPGVYWTSPENRRWLAASQHLLQSFQENGGMRAGMAGGWAA